MAPRNSMSRGSPSLLSVRAKLALFDNKPTNHGGGKNKETTKDFSEPLIRRRSLAEIRSPLTPMTPNAGRLSFSTPEAQKNTHKSPEKKNLGSDNKQITPSPSSAGSKNPPKKVPWNSKWKVSKSPQPKHTVNVAVENKDEGNHQQIPTAEHSRDRLYQLSRRHSAKLIAARASRQSQGHDTKALVHSTSTSTDETDKVVEPTVRKIVATPPKNLLQKRDKAIRKLYGAEISEKVSSSSEEADQKERKDERNFAKPKRHGFKVSVINNSSAPSAYNALRQKSVGNVAKTDEGWKGKASHDKPVLADDNAKNIFRSSFMEAFSGSKDEPVLKGNEAKPVPGNGRDLSPPKRRSSFVHRSHQPANGRESFLFEDEANEGNLPSETMYSRLLGRARGGPVSVVEIRRAASHDSRITDITEFTGANELATRTSVVFPQQKFLRNESRLYESSKLSGKEPFMNKSKPWEGLVPPPPPPLPPQTLTATSTNSSEDSAPFAARSQPKLSVRDRIVAHNRQRFEKSEQLGAKPKKDNNAWALGYHDSERKTQESSNLPAKDAYRSFHHVEVKTDSLGTLTSSESAYPQEYSERVANDIPTFHLSVRERIAFHNQNPIEPAGATPKSGFPHQASRTKQQVPKEPIGAISDADGKIEPTEGKRKDPESSGFKSSRNHNVLGEEQNHDPTGFTSNDDSNVRPSNQRKIQMAPSTETHSSLGLNRNPVDPESSEGVSKSVTNPNSVQQRIASLTQDAAESQVNSIRSKSLSPKRSPVVVKSARNRDEIEKLQSEVSDLRLRIKILNKDGNRTDLLELIEEKEEECREKGDQLKKLNEKLDTIERGLAEIEAERLSLTKKVHELETEKDRTEKQLRLREGEITSLAKRCLDQAEELKDVTAFRVEKNSMTKEIESLKESMEKKSLEDVTTIDCLKNKLNETKRARDELSIQLSKIKRDRDDCSRRLEDCLISNKELSKEKSRWEEEKSALLKDAERYIDELKASHEKDRIQWQNEVREQETEKKRLKAASDDNEKEILDLSKKLNEAKATAEETLKTLENTFESKLQSQNRYIDKLKQELTETAASLQSAQEMLHESEKTVAERDIIVEDLLEQLSEQERQAAEALQSVRDEFESQAIEALHMAKSNFCKLLQEFVTHSELEVKTLREEYEEQISSVQSRLAIITNDSEGRVEESQSIIERLNTQLSEAESKLTSIFERHDVEMKASQKQYEDSKVSLQQELDLLTAKYNQEIVEKNNEIALLMRTNADEQSQLERRISELVAEAQRSEEKVISSSSDFEEQVQIIKSDFNERTKELESQIASLQEKLDAANTKHIEEVTKKNAEIELLQCDSSVRQEDLRTALELQKQEAESLSSELSRTKVENDSTVARLTEQVASTELTMKEAIEKYEREITIQKEKIAYLESSGDDEKRCLLSKLQETEDAKNELILSLESELNDLRTSGRTQIESLDAQLAKMKFDYNAQIEKVEQEKAKQLSDFMESLKSKDSEIACRNSETLALEAEKSALEVELKESTGRIEERELAIEELKAELLASRQQLENKVASFSETLSSLNAGHLNDMENLCASHQREMSMLEAKLAERNMMIECLEKDMEAQMQQLMVTTTKLEEVQGDGKLVEGLTADIEALELERAAMEEDLHEKDMNIAELSAEILKLEIEKELVQQDSIEVKKANAKLNVQERQHALQLKEILASHAREQQKYSGVVASLQEDLQQQRDHVVSLQESLRRAEASLEKASNNAKLSDQVLHEKDKIIGELRSEVSKQMIENRGLASKLAVKEDEIRDLEVVEMYDKNEKIRLLQNNVDNLSAQLEFKSEQFGMKTAELENEASDLRKKLAQMCKQATDQRDSMQREIESFQKQCESSKREADFIKIKLEETERKLKDAKLDSASFSTKIHDLEVACKELQDNCRELQLAQQEVNNERDELTLRLEKEMGLVQEHEDIRWDLERRCDDLKQELDSRDETSLEQAKRIEDLERSMNDNKILNEELSRHNKELESFLQTQNLAVDQVQEEVKSLRMKLQAREDQIKELKAEKTNQEQTLLDELETERQNLQVATSELEAAQQKLGVLLRENKDIAELEKEREALQDKVRRQEAFLKRKLDKEKMGRATARPPTTGLQTPSVKRSTNPKRQSTPLSPELKHAPTLSTATMSTGVSKLDWELDCLLAD